MSTNSKTIGRLRGEWRPDVRYSSGDLVAWNLQNETYLSCFMDLSVTPSVTRKSKETTTFNGWWEALPEPVQNADRYPNSFRQSTNIGKQPFFNLQYGLVDNQGVVIPSSIQPAIRGYFAPDGEPAEEMWGPPQHMLDQNVVHILNYGAYWQISYWQNVTEEVTTFPNKFVREQSVNPHLLDSYILSKGIPPWYYYDLLGHYNTRLEIRNVVDLLRSIRGTIYGMKTFLNLINLEAEPHRMKPEERYDFSNYFWEQIRQSMGDLDPVEFNSIYNEEKFEQFRSKFYSILYPDTPLPEPKQRFVQGKAWSHFDPAANVFKTGDYCFKNWFEDDATETGYLGCSLYKCLQGNGTEPILNAPTRRGLFDELGVIITDPVWEWVYDFKIITKEEGFYRNVDNRSGALITTNYNPDNSLYSANITNLINTDNVRGGAIVRQQDQQKYTCYLKRLIEFLVPAWIRFEGNLYLLDEKKVGMEHVSWANCIYDNLLEGKEPYTLTIRPFVGFNPWDPEFRFGGELNHVSGWGVTVEAIGDNGYAYPIDNPYYEEPTSGIYTQIFEWSTALEESNPMIYEEGHVTFYHGVFWKCDVTHVSYQENPKMPGTDEGKVYWTDITVASINAGNIFWKSHPANVFVNEVRLYRKDYLREGDLALIKVQGKALRKFRITPIEQPRQLLQEGDTASEPGWTGLTFQKWQLLDWWHSVHDWKLLGMKIPRRHMDMEPAQHQFWENYTHSDIEEIEYKAWYFLMNPDECEIAYPALPDPDAIKATFEANKVTVLMGGYALLSWDVEIKSGYDYHVKLDGREVSHTGYTNERMTQKGDVVFILEITKSLNGEVKEVKEIKRTVHVLDVGRAPVDPSTPTPPIPPPPPPPLESEPEVGEIRYWTDERDGKQYRCVYMPDYKWWFAENYAYTLAGRYYDDNSENGLVFGKMYTWSEAMNTCPEGWRLPERSEYIDLFNIIGGAETAGTKLKSSEHWDYSEEAPVGTDIYGFSALPAGVSTFPESNQFGFLNLIGEWWTSHVTTYEYSSSALRIYYRREDCSWVNVPNHTLRSVRFVRDDWPEEPPPPPPPPLSEPEYAFDWGMLSTLKSGIYEVGELLEWQRNTNYSRGDIVYSPGECRFYICTRSHVSNKDRRPDDRNRFWRVVRERRFDEGLLGSQEVGKKGEIVLYLSRGDVTITPRWFGRGQIKMPPPLIIYEDGNAMRQIIEKGNTHLRCTFGGVIKEIGDQR